MESQLADLGFVKTVDEKEAETTEKEETKEIHKADEYPVVEYEAFLRNPENYIGKKAQFYGRLNGVFEQWLFMGFDDSDYTLKEKGRYIGSLKMNVNIKTGNQSELVEALFDNDKLPFKLLQNDLITVYGTITGEGSYHCPSLKLDYIEYDGTIYDVSYTTAN